MNEDEAALQPVHRSNLAILMALRPSRNKSFLIVLGSYKMN